jgi:predicted transglutaminase-like cysteine proteinase
VNVFQSVAILVVVQGIALAGCSQIDTINDTVNAYTYIPDVIHGMKELDANTGGDCEDYAYTKHLRICEQLPDLDQYMLFKAQSPTVSHIALMVDGKVLDNQKTHTYTYNENEWDITVPFACKQEG